MGASRGSRRRARPARPSGVPGAGIPKGHSWVGVQSACKSGRIGILGCQKLSSTGCVNFPSQNIHDNPHERVIDIRCTCLWVGRCLVQFRDTFLASWRPLAFIRSVLTCRAAVASLWAAATARCRHASSSPSAVVASPPLPMAPKTDPEWRSEGTLYNSQRHLLNRGSRKIILCYV